MKSSRWFGRSLHGHGAFVGVVALVYLVAVIITFLTLYAGLYTRVSYTIKGYNFPSPTIVNGVESICLGQGHYDLHMVALVPVNVTVMCIGGEGETPRYTSDLHSFSLQPGHGVSLDLHCMGSIVLQFSALLSPGDVDILSIKVVKRWP